jgi:tetratricopeptide (TPR) repeat protein
VDLSIIIADWPYDEDEDANNVRKVLGIDGRMKVQVRIRGGILQWDMEGRPDGQKPHGCPSVLDYCSGLLAREGHEGALPDGSTSSFNAELTEELTQELFDYYRRGRALFLLGDYRRALGDALHNLKLLKVMRENCSNAATAFSHDRYRPSLLVDCARAEMLLNLQAGEVRRALDALNKGIRDVESFYVEYELEERLGDSTERQILVDLRRSLREKHNVPLNDEELLHSLRVEQEIAIRRENYEMAARLRDKIRSLRQRIASDD